MAPKDSPTNPVAAQLGEMCGEIRTLRTRLEDHVKHTNDLSELARKKLDDFIQEVRKHHIRIGENLDKLSEAVGRVHRRIDRLIMSIGGAVIIGLVLSLAWVIKELMSKT